MGAPPIEHEADAAREAAPQGPVSAWFAGRCDRREYWLLVGPFLAGAYAVNYFLPFGMGGPAVSFVLGLAILVVWIRRLHDLGLTGWLAPLVNLGARLASFLAAGLTTWPGAPFLASLSGIVLLGLLPGQPHRNRFGAPPGAEDFAKTFG